MGALGQTQSILVLGGYGLIGSSITRKLIADGHSVTGLGRNAAKGQAVSPEARWVSADLNFLTRAEDWHDLLAGIDIVINASGVLQTGLFDKVSTVQTDAICALIDACKMANITRFVQISAPGVDLASDTEFYRSKAKADAHLTASDLNWTIFRPGLVLSPGAYGGTSLVRLLSAFPLVQPIVLPDAVIQTVHIEDVSNAVSHAVADRIEGDFDLVAPQTTSLKDVVLSFRQWLGFGKPAATITLPGWMGHLTALGADIAGWLGWRTALRTTSIKVLTSGVTGDPAAWTNASGQCCKTLNETLNALPSTAQERIYARVMLAFPICLILLSFFWMISGAIGFWKMSEAVSVLDGALPDAFSRLFVIGGSVADIAVGALLLIRPFTRKAAMAGALLSLGYVVASLIFTPHLWADPLGPMMKVLPVIAFNALIASIAEER